MKNLNTLTTDELLDMACDLEADMIGAALEVANTKHCDLVEAMDSASQNEDWITLYNQWNEVAKILDSRNVAL